MSEHVFAVPTELFVEKIHTNDNFIKINFTQFIEVLEYGDFFERNKIEDDTSFKQIIPYIVFKNGKDQFLVLKRTENQGEKRLHNLISLGIGGHINKRDEGYTKEQTFFNGMDREINEELWLSHSAKYVYKGIIRDNSEDVSNVHIGVLFEGYVEYAEIKEVDNFESTWLTKSEIEKLENVKLETWAKITLENI
jgi:predicted NUDIX family phosphoesterase